MLFASLVLKLSSTLLCESTKCTFRDKFMFFSTLILLLCFVACKNGYYKEKSGIHGCWKCPENTLSNTNKTGCVCKENHYRKGDIGPCLGKIAWNCLI